MSTFYTLTTDTGDVLYAVASSDSEALSIFYDAYPDQEVDDYIEDTKSKINLLDPVTYSETFKILSRTKKSYIVSGNDMIDATDRLHAMFPGEVAKTIVLLTGDFSLITGSTPPPQPVRPFGGNTHWGQNNNADYNQGNLDIGFQAVQAMSWNAIKTDITLSADGVPSSTVFQPFLDAVAAAGNLDLWGIVTTQNKRGSGSNAIPDPYNGSTYIYGELYEQFTIGYNKAKGFISKYPGVFKAIEAGNDNASKVLKAGQPGTVFDDNNYDTETYKMVFAEMFGILKGVKDVDPTILVGVNYSATHYGFAQQVSKDAITKQLSFDFCGNLWYSDSEYGNITSGPAAGKAAQIMFDNLTGLYSKLGFSGFGLRADQNPQSLTKADYVIDQMNKYWFAEPKLDFMVGVYELFNEPALGAGSVESQFGLQDGTSGTLSADVVTLSAIKPNPESISSAISSKELV